MRYLMSDIQLWSKMSGSPTYVREPCGLSRDIGADSIVGAIERSYNVPIQLQENRASRGGPQPLRKWGLIKGWIGIAGINAARAHHVTDFKFRGN